MKEGEPMQIAVPDQVQPFSGIGVIQNELYPRLEAGGHVVRPYLDREPGPGTLGGAKAVLRALTRPVPHEADVFFGLTSPFPLRVGVPSVGVVHDLRWMRTRSGLGRLYRGWDFRRTVAHSDVLVTVSQRSADDIRTHQPQAEPRVVYPGPGQYDGPALSAETGEDAQPNRDVLLIGAAQHKRNELAARALGLLPADWCGTIRCINVSPETRELLTSITDHCEFHTNVSSSELSDLYRKSGFSLQLSVEEGFGLPYLEALSAGCIVVAVDQPLTRELLGDAAVLVQDGGPHEVAEQLRSRTSLPTRESRAARAARYSWDAFADGIVRALEDAVARAGS
jgi:glycosyltransferase involved in cell wall biosynthesis